MEEQKGMEIIDNVVMNTCYNMKCEELMRILPLQFFDCIITDPPYEVDFDSKVKDGYTEGVLRDNIDLPIDKNILAKLFWKVLKFDAYIVIFCSEEQIVKWVMEMEWVGFKFVQLLIWKKRNITHPRSRYKVMSNHEPMLVFIKGSPKKRVSEQMVSCMEFPIDDVKTRVHPTQKPIALLQHLIQIYTNEKNIIYDPFAGSGSMLKAGKLLNRKVVGTDVNEKFVKHINSELRNIEPLKKSESQQRII